MNTLYSISGGFVIFFIVLLLSKRNRQLADTILAIWFALILLGILFIYAKTNAYIKWQGFNELADCLVLLHGPLIWFYATSLTKEGFSLDKRQASHFLPFVFALIYLFLPLVYGRTISLFERNAFLILKMSHLLIYTMGVYRILLGHEKRIGNLFSFKEDVELGWLKLVVVGIISIWVISVFSQFLYAMNFVDIPQYGGYFTNFAISIFVLIMGFYGIKQTSIFAQNINALNVNPQKQDLPIEENLIREEVNPLYVKLLNYMEGEKPYLKGDLSIYELASDLSISPHQLSKLINRHGGQNFFDFVNTYRLAEVRNAIEKGQHHQKTLLAIGLEAGFNSKASFNRVFKKKMGITPREYAKGMSLD